MGCVASRLEQEEEVVSICRERKRLLKLAVQSRYALADSHYRYCKSLYGVSAALNLFVARHSTPASPYYITLPPAPSPPTKENDVVPAANPLFLQQTPSQPTKETVAFDYPYMGTSHAATMPSPQRDFGGWDFFNPFTDVAREDILSAYDKISEVVAEDMNVAGMSLEEEVHGGLAVTDTPVRGRELLEALRDIEDHFLRAYDSGKDVCRMLECNRVHLLSNLEELKGEIFDRELDEIDPICYMALCFVTLVVL